MIGIKNWDLLLNLLINHEIFRWEEGIVASLFYIHWPAVLEGKERGRGKNEIYFWFSFYLVFMVSGCERYKKLTLFPGALSCVFGDRPVAGNCQLAFCFTSGSPAVAATSDPHAHPQTLWPPVPVTGPSVSFSPPCCFGRLCLGMTRHSPLL